MIARKFSIVVGLLAAAILVAACRSSVPAAQPENGVADVDPQAEESEHREEARDHYVDESDHHADEMDEHQTEGTDHGHVETPAEFRDMSNPLAGNKEAVATGQEIYEANCVTCHGPQGEGDGPAAAALDPQPVSLADSAMMQAHGDGYLFWRISEGGAMEPFNSAMLAYKEALSEEEIWQVISYVRMFSQDSPEMRENSEPPHIDVMSDDHHEDEADHHEDEANDHHEDEADHHE